MKKYLYLFVFAVMIGLQADAQKPNIEQALDLFPYQHVSDIQGTLQNMENWKKSDWKKVFVLLQNDSLKLINELYIKLELYYLPENERESWTGNLQQEFAPLFRIYLRGINYDFNF